MLGRGVRGVVAAPGRGGFGAVTAPGLGGIDPLRAGTEGDCSPLLELGDPLPPLKNGVGMVFSVLEFWDPST